VLKKGIHNYNYNKMKLNSKIYKLYETKLNLAKNKNNEKDTLKLNIWYNQFGLVYFKSVAL